LSSFRLQRIESREDPAWDAFLDRAPGATLFHRLSFLAYHPDDRFRRHHVAAWRGDRLVAVIPAAEGTAEGLRDLRSPYGGSFGGWVTAPELDAVDLRSLDGRLLGYAADRGFDTVTITSPPSPYDATGVPAAARERAAVAAGARMIRRELTHIVPLHTGRVRGSARRSARTAERAGMTVRAGHDADLDVFHAMLAADKARLGATPTHSADELREIRRRHPEATRLHLAELAGTPVAGILVFRCAPAIDLVFYAARDPRSASRTHGCMNLLYGRAMADARARGAAWLDLGTSSVGGVVNPGLSFFKESMGGVAFERVTRRFAVAAVPASAIRPPAAASGAPPVPVPGLPAADRR